MFPEKLPPTLSKPFLDRRLPPADTMGALTDAQVQLSQLHALGERVKREWQDVQTLRCELRGKWITFFIGIKPWTNANQQRHWPVADLIEEELKIAKDRCIFLFLPTAQNEPYPGEVVIL